jgi:hypothetical protein
MVTRAEWGARPPKRRFVIPCPTRELWLHHTAGNHNGPAGVREVQRFHMDSRGWADIAYSFLVDDDGTVYEGRGAGVAGGHTEGHNSISHAICAMGNYEAQVPGEALLSAIRRLGAAGRDRGWWPAQFTGGHRNASGALTACPGSNLYAQLPALTFPTGSEPQREDDDEMQLIVRHSNGSLWCVASDFTSRFAIWNEDRTALVNAGAAKDAAIRDDTLVRVPIVGDPILVDDIDT